MLRAMQKEQDEHILAMVAVRGEVALTGAVGGEVVSRVHFRSQDESHYQTNLSAVALRLCYVEIRVSHRHDHKARSLEQQKLVKQL